VLGRPNSDSMLLFWFLVTQLAHVCLARYRGHLSLSVFTARRYAKTVYAVVVCLSVCVSVTLQYCIKTAKRRITQITPHDSPMTLVF